MTTKDFCSSSLFKSPKFGDTGDQYNSINLNSNVNHSLCNLGPSKKNRVILFDTNSKFGQVEETKSRYSNKFSSADFFTKSFDYLNFKEEKEDGVQVAWKKSYSDNGRGLLSLHIPPQEKPEIDDAYDKGRKWKTSKQYFDELKFSAALKTAFEFPRQQEGGDKLHNPEIMKFKTSQQLLNPNASSVVSDDNNTHQKNTSYMPSKYTPEKYCFEYDQAAANSIKPNFMESSYIFSKLSETAIEVFKKKTASQMEAEKTAVLESDDFDRMFILSPQFDQRVLLSNKILPLGPDEETWLGIKCMLPKWCAFKIYSAEDNSIKFYPAFGQFKSQTAVRVLKTPECSPCTNFNIGFVYMDKQVDDLKSLFSDHTTVEFKNVKICEPEPPVTKVPIISSLPVICFEQNQMEVSVKLSNSHEYRHALKILFDDEDSYSCEPNELIIESEQEASVMIKKLKNNARDSKLQIAYKPVYDGETPIEDVLFSSTDDILTIPVKSTE